MILAVTGSNLISACCKFLGRVQTTGLGLEPFRNSSGTVPVARVHTCSTASSRSGTSRPPRDVIAVERFRNGSGWLYLQTFMASCHISFDRRRQVQIHRLIKDAKNLSPSPSVLISDDLDITIYLHINFIFLVKTFRSCVRRTDSDLLLSTKVTFLQSNIGH